MQRLIIPGVVELTALDMATSARLFLIGSLPENETVWGDIEVSVISDDSAAITPQQSTRIAEVLAAHAHILNLAAEFVSISSGVSLELLQLGLPAFSFYRDTEHSPLEMTVHFQACVLCPEAGIVVDFEGDIPFGWSDVMDVEDYS
ncbi:MAG: hypothetical protein LBE24_02540 [Methylobacillus sp.]|jgi:hypothetical protein|nr:hypothetical protein [Methylobacillus sp.]